MSMLTPELIDSAIIKFQEIGHHRPLAGLIHPNLLTTGAIPSDTGYLFNRRGVWFYADEQVPLFIPDYNDPRCKFAVAFALGDCINPAKLVLFDGSLIEYRWPSRTIPDLPIPPRQTIIKPR